MSIATDTLPFFRTQWANRLTDTCTVTRVSGQTFNTNIGVYEAGTTTTRYSGACLVRPQAAKSVQYGEELVEVRRYDVYIPSTSTTVVPDDKVTVTSATDGQLTGKVLIVRNVETDTYNTRRRLECDLDSGA